MIAAGPNGAGKTTFAREFLPAEGRCPTFSNADLIAAGVDRRRSESVIQHPSKYPDLQGSRTAMIRAAHRAAEVARPHQQLLLWRDGQIARVMPDQLPPLPEETPTTADGR